MPEQPLMLSSHLSQKPLLLFRLHPQIRLLSSLPPSIPPRILHQISAKIPPPLSNGFQPHHLESILLHLLRSDPASSIRLFQWSNRHLHLPPTLPSLSTVAHAYISLKNFENAREITHQMIKLFAFSDVLSFFPNNCTSFRCLIECCYDLRMTREAAECFSTARCLIECCYDLRMTREAAECFSTAREMGISFSLDWLVGIGRTDEILRIYGELDDGYVAIMSVALKRGGDATELMNWHRDLVEGGLFHRPQPRFSSLSETLAPFQTPPPFSPLSVVQPPSPSPANSPLSLHRRPRLHFPQKLLECS
ncbi:uncharacterized protein A4U43_C04F10130 [Asparagus officinalis]|uniref:Pentatricopeptide repeat-containing protein n=1 Tax=Asparagus officinalis TaxID=4686 RepID=A0A5P1F2F2_ASPOF|nr:uncharacterized protein A4U43_C04F10130 [Asparagus officinalis]